MANAKQNAIEAANAELNNVGLPTYTELQAALNELAVYVQRGAGADAIALCAERAIKLSNAA